MNAEDLGQTVIIQESKLKHFFSNGMNRIFRYVSQTFLPIISMFFCGHIGSNELAAVTIANTFINIGSFSVLVGLCSACDTLLPQLFGGVDKKKVGLVVQKGLIISFLSCFPTSGILLNVKNLMKFFVQERIVINLADQYIVTYLPAIIFYSLHIVLQRYVLSQNIFYPILFINILTNVINVFLHYLFVFQFNLGVVGAAISVVISNFLILVFVLSYIIYSKMYILTWSGWTRECLYNWSEYLKLAIPGFAMLFFGLANFEIGVIAAGKLGKVGISIMSIGIQTTYIAFMIPLGISISANIRIGQLLGENSPELAKNSCKVSYTFGAIASILTCLLMFFTSSIIPLAFTSEGEIIPHAVTLLKFLSFAHIMDALQGIGGGILKAMGAQFYGFLMVVISLYFIGIPLGIMLMLKTDYQVLGYWIGYLVGASVLILQQLTFILNINWTKNAQHAYNRSLRSSETKLVQSGEFCYGESSLSDKTPLLKNEKLKLRTLFIKKFPAIMMVLSIFVFLFLVRFYFFDEDKQLQQLRLDPLSVTPEASKPTNYMKSNTTGIFQRIFNFFRG
ncbi:unnamed protein product [Brachionus calyciflorus]|uniref:Multidrug and toxin extrusion protein n=1 Tax=Brachionus calyciflorus TaxID=104777 RepID=A0A813MWA0_9BILA|nr:unnamed protein product [Brachionus calyciflorus]